MSSPYARQENKESLITVGHAMVHLADGAEVLMPRSQRLDRILLRAVHWLYMRRLRELVAHCPADIRLEILADVVR